MFLKISVSEKSSEPFLLEMMIGCKGCLHALFLHQNETDSITEGVVLVRASLYTSDRLFMQKPIYPYDFDQRVPRKMKLICLLAGNHRISSRRSSEPPLSSTLAGT